MQQRQMPPKPASAAMPEAPPIPPASQSVKASAFGRCYLSGYVKDFKMAPTPQGTPIPLEPQRAEGGFALKHGVLSIPADGYYMLLWEIGITRAQEGHSLRLGINQAGTALNHALKPGYDSGQQVTWLGEGDQLSLQIIGAAEQEEIHGSSAQLTALRMG